MFKFCISQLVQSAVLMFLIAETIPVIAQAQVTAEVAFFEYRTKDGRLVSIEPDGQRYHVAIKTKQGWLHSHPFYGVVLEENIHKIGQLVSVLSSDILIDDRDFEKEYGKKFSITDSWDDRTSTYCSKLVAQILNIKPSLMKNGKGWGLSPDDIYFELKHLNYSEKKSCRMLFQ
jgi:hypothetical protein